MYADSLFRGLTASDIHADSLFRALTAPVHNTRPPRYECVTENYLSNFSTKHMLWVLKKTVSMRQFF